MAPTGRLKKILCYFVLNLSWKRVVHLKKIGVKKFLKSDQP